MKEQGSFKKEIKLFDGIMLVAGTMIGSGIFIVSAEIARNVGSSGYLLLVWGLAGILTIVAAVSYGELTSMFPKAGGQYVFLREAYNPLVAFLYGWTFFLVIQTGTIAAVGVAFAKFTGVFFPLFDGSHIVADLGFVKVNTQQLLAIAVIAFLSYINISGVKNGKLIQTFFGGTKIFALLALVLIGIFVHNADAIHLNFSGIWNASSTVVEENHAAAIVTPLMGWGLIVAIGVAMIGSMFAMDAWNGITFAGDEVVNPKRTIPISMAVGTMVVALIYLAVNVIYLTNLPLAGKPDGINDFTRGIQFATNDRVGAAVADVMSGHTALLIISGLIILSTFSCLNGCILTGARLYYKMADDGLFFKGMRRLNKNGVPAVATIFQGVWASVLCLSGTYGNLLNYVVFAVLVFYILSISGIFILRRKQPTLERPYKAWGYPVVQIIYVAIITFICAILLIYKPDYSWPGFIIVLIGIPAYFIFKSIRGKDEGDGMNAIPDR